MAGNNRPPYRTPCAGWTYAWNGQKYQNGRRVEKSVPTYNQTNTSQTYRWPIDYLTGDLGSSCTTTPTNCGSGTPPRCGAFPYVLQTPMVYELSGDTADYSVCKKIGHKNVQARKSWHGTWGFGEAPGCVGFKKRKFRTAEVTFNLDGTDTLSGLSWYQHKHINSTVGKDTGIVTLNDAVVNDYSNQGVDCSNYTLAHWDYLGVFAAGCEITLRLPYLGTTTDCAHQFFEPTTFADMTELEDFLISSEWWVDGGGETPTPNSGSYQHGWQDVTINNLSRSGNHFICDFTLHRELWNWDSGTESDTTQIYQVDYDYLLEISLSDEYSLQDVLDDCQTLTAEWNIADDVEYPWRTDEYLTIAPLVSRDEYRVYTDAAGYQYGAVEPLLDFPSWSVDNYASPTSSLPYSSWTQITDKDPNSVIFDWADTFATAQSNGYGGTSDQWYNETEATMATYVAANSIAYNRFTGGIKGSPSGYPGIFPDASPFDYEHVTWYSIACPSGGSADLDNLTPYVERIGAKSGDNHDPTDSVVPIQSTQWTNNYDGCLFPPGAFIRVAGDSVHVQSAVFTLLPIPSMNYGRPCGADRYRPDETKTACVDSDNGTDIVVHADASSSIPSGSVCLVRDGGGNDGVFTLTTADGLTYTRSGAKIADIPANILYEPELDSDNFIAKVRFPSAPGICGRISVVSATQDGASVHIVVDDTVYLQVGDDVDFTGVTGLGSNVNVDSIESATSFTVTGTLSGAYVSGGYVSSSGAAAYYWNDDSQKGDYVHVEWVLDNTGAVDSYVCTTACLPFLTCDPGVVGHWLGSPTFPNGAIESLPSAAGIIYDGTRDGVVWQGGVWVGMPDLYFQTPHMVKGSDCDTAYTMKDDDGGCNSDEVTTIYYPSAGRVEARCELPTIGAETAPALSGTATFPDFSIPPSAIATQYAGGDYNGVLQTGLAVTEHGNYLAKYSCVCGEVAGRFASIYESQGITCC